MEEKCEQFSTDHEVEGADVRRLRKTSIEFTFLTYCLHISPPDGSSSPLISKQNNL